MNSSNCESVKGAFFQKMGFAGKRFLLSPPLPSPLLPPVLRSPQFLRRQKAKNHLRKSLLRRLCTPLYPSCTLPVPLLYPSCILPVPLPYPSYSVPLIVLRGVRGGRKAFDIIIKLFIRSDGSDIVLKVIPQLCPTAVETAF